MISMRRCALLLLVLSSMTVTSKGSSAADEAYCTDLQDCENPDWSDLKETLTIGSNSYGPAYGSTIQVNQDMIKAVGSSFTNRATLSSQEKAIALHTPTHSYIGSDHFYQMTRWYQEDYNTQVFRMFRGDDNVRNSRANAPRSEVFGIVSWKKGDGWYEWSGRYTFLKVRQGAVFQIKHNITYWSLQLILEKNHNKNNDGTTTTTTFDLYYVKLHDRSSKTLLMEDVVGKGVDIRVMDDGTNHKVYVNEELMVENSMTDRPKGDRNRFRWGIYSPGSAMDCDILILVTGVSFGPREEGATGGQKDCSSSMVSWLVPDALQSWFASFFEFESVSGNHHHDNDVLVALQNELDGEPNPVFLSKWYGNSANEGYGFF